MKFHEEENTADNCYTIKLLLGAVQTWPREASLYAIYCFRAWVCLFTRADNYFVNSDRKLFSLIWHSGSLEQWWKATPKKCCSVVLQQGFIKFVRFSKPSIDSVSQGGTQYPCEENVWSSLPNRIPILKRQSSDTTVEFIGPSNRAFVLFKLKTSATCISIKTTPLTESPGQGCHLAQDIKAINLGRGLWRDNRDDDDDTNITARGRSAFSLTAEQKQRFRLTIQCANTHPDLCIQTNTPTGRLPTKTIQDLIFPHKNKPRQIWILELGSFSEKCSPRMTEMTSQTEAK